MKRDVHGDNVDIDLKMSVQVHAVADVNVDAQEIV
jgi:hypothetical protein